MPAPPPRVDRADRVLVVDDDAGIRELLTSALGYAGFEVTAVGTVAAALDALRATPPDILVLDVVLPDSDGLAMLRMVRGAGDRTPVLLLSALDTPADRTAGLTAGGDDYVTKPFDIGEVVARLHAILRRARGAGPGGDGAAGDGAVGDRTGPQGPDDGVLTYDDLVVDTERLLVRRGDRTLELTPTEFRLLATLAATPGRVISKAQLLDRLWGYDFGGDTAVVEKVVSRLRRKVDDGAVPLIRTVRGFGYTLRREDA